jgi:hypothetical protein
MAGCGCKNKSQNPPSQTPAPSTPSTPSNQKPQSNNIQESIKKVVEKYYNKK